MPATQTAPSQTPSIETVWAILQEVGKIQKETSLQMKETDRQMQETDRRMQETDRKMQETDRQMQETDRQMKETDRRMQETDRQMQETDRRMQETDRQMKETDRQIKETTRKMDEYNKRFGDFTNRFGEVVEYMIAPNLVEKFKELGHIFLQSVSDARVVDRENDIHFEIDVKLENGAKAMLVEVKTKLTAENVKEHVERLEKMRRYADLHGDKRSFLGAVAGVVITPYAKKYALKQGFFVVEPSGETFNITPPSGKPKEW